MKILLENIYVSQLFLEQKEEEIILPETIIKNEINVWEEIKEEQYDIKGVDVVCWECGLYFTGKIWGIPIYSAIDTVYKKSDKYKIYHNLPDSLHKKEKNVVKRNGNFCNICCAIRYLLTSLDFSTQYKKNYLKLLYYEYGKYVGKTVKYIPPAYSKNNMKIYKGGEGWSELEFKEKNKKLEQNEIIY